jgi:hypothetical protein
MRIEALIDRKVFNPGLLLFSSPALYPPLYPLKRGG